MVVLINKNLVYKIAFLILVSICLLPTAFAVEKKQVLRDIQVSEKANEVAIRVNFNKRVRAIRHFPPTAGEILQIQLEVTGDKKSAGSRDDIDSDIAKRESMLPPKNNLVPLVSVTYEGDVPGGPYLTLRFKFAVEFRLEEGSDGKSIHILVKRDKGKLSVKGSKGGVSLISDQKIEELMAESKRVLAKGDYGRAIQLFNKLLKFPSHKYTREAKELLGLARERKGQVARAKLEYKDYIRLYPKGEGTDRVKQRLAAINAKQRLPRKKLKTVKGKDQKFRMDTFGRFLQRFFHDRTDFDSNTSELTSLTSIINVSSRMNVQNYDVRAFFNAHDVHDFERSERSQSRVNTFYVDVRNKVNGFSAKLGRQSSSKGGVFGRFDGLWASYQLNPQWVINATVGKPVNFSSSSIDADKSFYGVSATLGTFLNRLDGNIYYINQNVEGITDREAIGGDARYSDKRFTLFSSVDYDISYSKLNIFLLRGGWQVNKRLRLNLNYSDRQSPLVFTSNALQQENVGSFDELLALSTEDAIRAKVLALTSSSTLGSIGATYQLSKNMQLNGDISVTTLEGKPGVNKLVPNPISPTILAVGDTGPDLSINTQLVASNYFVKRDVNIIGLRLSDRDTRDTILAFVRSRFPYKRKWRFGTRFAVEYLNNSNDDSTRFKYTASGKVDYRWRKKVNFDAEMGFETTKNNGGNALDFNRLFVIFGYFIDF